MQSKKAGEQTESLEQIELEPNEYVKTNPVLAYDSCNRDYILTSAHSANLSRFTYFEPDLAEE